MSNAVVIAAIVGSFSIAPAYAAAPPPAGASAKIHGQVLHPAGKTVTVQIRGQQPVEAPLDAKGAFSLTVPVPEAGAAQLHTGQEYTDLWLSPGDDLTLTLDAARFDETVKYSGRGARVNNLLAAEVLAAEEIDARTEAAMARPPAGFGAFADSVKAVRQQRLTAALAGKPTPEETAFKTRKQQQLAYEWAALRLSYGREKHVPTTDPFYSFLTSPEIPLDNPAAVTSDAYRGFVNAALTHYAAAVGSEGSTLGALRQGAQRLTGPVRAAVLPDLAMEGVAYAPLAEADSLQRYALTRLDLTPKMRTSLEKSWARRQLTRAGLPAPDPHALTPEGKAFDLASLRGKVVYLDFWASWCGPCIGEMPAAKKLHAALHDRAQDVVFLNVSIDGQAANWKKGITKHGVEGVNVHSVGDWESEAVKAYGLASIPRYLIIGPDGRILDGDAPRPSGGAEAAIRAALAKQ